MKQLFGTDGIRGRMGQSPLTAQELVRLGATVGAWIQAKHPHASVLLAHDTRYSASLVKAALKAGLLQYPLIIHDGQVLPTPALFQQVTQGPYDYGIMITASHNPYQDNGIKIITKTHGKLTERDEDELNALYADTLPAPSYENLGEERNAPDVIKSYLAALTQFFPADFLQGTTLVLDCAQGSYASFAPQLLSSFGARVIPLALFPNGKNINAACGSLHPAFLQQVVTATGAQAGFAFDGDGDRLIAVNQEGVGKDGDELLAFLLNHPLYCQEQAVVGTILSNEGLAHHLAHHNKLLYRTAVGDKYVIEKMKQCGALVGGEPSGHLILRDFTDTADGLFTLLRIAQTAQHIGNWQLAGFTKFPHIALNVPVSSKKDLTLPPYADIIASHKAVLSEGRIIVRYSGTEPLLRIVVEATTSEQAAHIGHLLSQHLTQALTKE